MTAAELLAHLRSKGVILIAAGDRIRWRPREAVSAEEQDTLLRHKPEVLSLLQGDVSDKPEPRDDGPSPLAGAMLYFQDERGRPCDRDASNLYRWTWAGAARWWPAARYPPPGFHPGAAEPQNVGASK
jgi:hypothetical protein